MKRNMTFGLAVAGLMMLTGCFGGRFASLGRGGEVVGVGGKAFAEPTPYGMTLVPRGSLKMGLDRQDSLWGKPSSQKDSHRTSD